MIGAIQAQEVVKRLHDLNALAGSGYVFEGLGHNSYPVEYSVNPDCPWHEEPTAIESVQTLSSNDTLGDVVAHAMQQLGDLDALDLAREIVVTLNCTDCGASHRVFKPVDRVEESDALCEKCQKECYPELVHSIEPNSKWLDMTIRDFGLPLWDVIWARSGTKAIGFELTGDSASALKGEG